MLPASGREGLDASARDDRPCFPGKWRGRDFSTTLHFLTRPEPTGRSRQYHALQAQAGAASQGPCISGSVQGGARNQDPSHAASSKVRSRAVQRVLMSPDAIGHEGHLPSTDGAGEPTECPFRQHGQAAFQRPRDCPRGSHQVEYRTEARRALSAGRGFEVAHERAKFAPAGADLFNLAVDTATFRNFSELHVPPAPTSTSRQEGAQRMPIVARRSCFCDAAKRMATGALTIMTAAASNV